MCHLLLLKLHIAILAAWQQKYPWPCLTVRHRSPALAVDLMRARIFNVINCDVVSLSREYYGLPRL